MKVAKKEATEDKKEEDIPVFIPILTATQYNDYAPDDLPYPYIMPHPSDELAERFRRLEEFKTPPASPTFGIYSPLKFDDDEEDRDDHECDVSTLDLLCFEVDSEVFEKTKKYVEQGIEKYGHMTDEECDIFIKQFFN